jgi:hypothetical protein
MPYNDLRAEHPVRYDKPGSPYLAIDAVMDGWPITPVTERTSQARPKDCHLCGWKGAGGTCEKCLDKLRMRAEKGLVIFPKPRKQRRGGKKAA